jgi:starvation-inducible DNA-binding protein
MADQPIRNALDSNIKATSVALLNARLADTIDLALAVKQAHWTLKGAAFIAVHEMLDRLRDDLNDYADTMAERAATLGGTPLGTVQVVAKTTTLEAYPLTLRKIPDHVHALAERTAALGNAVRENIDAAASAGDADTADVFTEVSRGLDKWLWLIESHLPA